MQSIGNWAGTSGELWGTTYTSKNKTAELGNFISVSDPDILIDIGTETWLNQTITDNEFFPPGYSLLWKDRQDGYEGGTTSH